MEGDAGASRLNPPPMPIARRLRKLPWRPGRKARQESGADAAQVSPEAAKAQPEETVDETANETVDETANETIDDTASETSSETANESPESKAATEAASPAAAKTEAASVEEAASPDETTEAAPQSGAEAEAASLEDAGETVGRGPSRLGRGWVAGIVAALVLCAAAVGAGGYLALRYHHESQAIARNDAAAIKAAVDCVSATQAPDTATMAASEQKIIDCGTDAFHSQALLYTNMLVQAYQAANVHVQVSDVRAAVERNNKDGSIDVLVAMRVKVASDKANNETGYRLRVKMAVADGQYKIAKLDQVTK
jgi:hypothetical protein